VRRLVLLLSGGALAAVQAAPERALPAAPLEFPEPFTRVASIRELGDGRLLVVDGGDAVVRLLDLTRGTATQVGRQGGGPGEYKAPGRLLPLPGGATLLTDGAQQRSIVISPEGSAGDVLLSSSALLAAPPGARAPIATDAKGRLYFLGNSAPKPGGEIVLPDSAPLHRFDPVSRQLDTLTRLKLAWRDVRVKKTNGKITSVNILRVPLMEHDDWAVLPDGRVAVVRTREYRLDVSDAGDRIIPGPRIPYTAIPVTDAERKAAQEWAKLPKLKPPFDGPSTWAAPDSRIWVQRTTAAGDSTARYDVLGLNGRLLAKVSLPPRTRVAGFGREAVYLVRKDADDLEHLGRLALPKF
jgi:hypothetical protein